MYVYIYTRCPAEQTKLNYKKRCIGERTLFSKIFWRSCCRSKHTFQPAQTTAGRLWRSHRRWWFWWPLPRRSSGCPGPEWSPPRHPSLSWRGRSRPVQDLANGRMLQHLDPLHRHPLLQAGGCMDRCIVPMEPPLLLGHGGHLLLKMLQEGDQDLDCVGGVDRGAPGGNMCIDHAARVKKTP